MVPRPGLLGRPRRLGTVRSSSLVSIGTSLEPARYTARRSRTCPTAPSPAGCGHCHHTPDHIVGGPVGLAHRLGYVVYRYAVERPAKVHPDPQHPDPQHPVPEAYVPIVQEGSRLVVERLLAGLAGVPLEFPVFTELDDVCISFRAVDAVRPPHSTEQLCRRLRVAKQHQQGQQGPRPPFSRFWFVAPAMGAQGICPYRSVPVELIV